MITGSISRPMAFRTLVSDVSLFAFTLSFLLLLAVDFFVGPLSVYVSLYNVYLFRPEQAEKQNQHCPSI